MKWAALPIRFSFNGADNTIYPAVVSNGSETVLIDCGYAGFMPLIENALHAAGFSPAQLTGILITHHDIDHVGGLHEWKEKYPALQVMSPDAEEAFINGRQRSQRLVQAESIYDSLPDGQKAGALQFQEFLQTVRPVPVDRTFALNEKPWLIKGARIIHTPGHMPGHISVYLEDEKVLIAADAVVYENGQLDIANPGFALDLPEAVRSVKKLMALPVDTLVCYHGGVVTEDIHEKMHTLIAGY